MPRYSLPQLSERNYKKERLAKADSSMQKAGGSRSYRGAPLTDHQSKKSKKGGRTRGKGKDSQRSESEERSGGASLD